MATSHARSPAPTAQVSSILSNPDQDPHLFEASPSVARQLATAAIVIYSGADYDPWMTKLLAATRSRPIATYRRCRHRPQEAGRQSAPLVRSPDHAGVRQRAGRGTRPTATRPTRPSTMSVCKASLPRSSRCNKKSRKCAANSRHPGHRHRAGVRLHGSRTRLDHAQPALSARRDERHRTPRLRCRRD